MIHFLDHPPKKCFLAFSGGIDSAVLLHILHRRKYQVTLLNIHHSNEWAEVEHEFTKTTAEKYGIPYVFYKIPPAPTGTSLEGYWSDERDKIYQSMESAVITAHHLNDAVEWYIMSGMQGCYKLINYQRRNVYRPLLITPKIAILQYAEHYGISYIEDPTNADLSFNLRNGVRHELLDDIKKYFPGIENTVRRMIVKRQRGSKAVKEP